ncbi:hypothetical protein ACET3Z_024518 [Daucus carota]
MEQKDVPLLGEAAEPSGVPTDQAADQHVNSTDVFLPNISEEPISFKCIKTDLEIMKDRLKKIREEVAQIREELVQEEEG